MQTFVAQHESNGISRASGIGSIVVIPDRASLPRVLACQSTAWLSLLKVRRLELRGSAIERPEA
jgi:hypothetical protein